MAKSHIENSKLAFSKLAVTNLGLAVSTPCSSSGPVKLSLTLFDNTQESRTPTTNARTVESLIGKASKISDDVQRWVTSEAEPLFLSNASSQPLTPGHIEYPDLMSGVLDCVADMALVTIGKILRSLCHARLRSSSLLGQDTENRLRTCQLLDNPEAIEQCRFVRSPGLSPFIEFVI